MDNTMMVKQVEACILKKCMNICNPENDMVKNKLTISYDADINK